VSANIALREGRWSVFGDPGLVAHLTTRAGRHCGRDRVRTDRRRPAFFGRGAAVDDIAIVAVRPRKSISYYVKGRPSASCSKRACASRRPANTGSTR
jgi:hypothetical protein